MLSRERAAMDAEYWQSFVAQRYYYRSAQLPALSPISDRTYTWQHAYEQTHGHWLGALQVLRNLRDMLRRGMHRRALDTLRDELSSDEAEEAEEEEPESDADMEEAPDAALAMQLRQEMETTAPSAGAPAWFTGTVHRLG